MTDTPHDVVARREIVARLLRSFASTADAAAIRLQREADSERFRRDAYLEAATAIEGSTAVAGEARAAGIVDDVQR